MSLKERIHEVEGDSEEAFRARRQLVRLLVAGIVSTDRRKGEAQPRVRITYRFDAPTSEQKGVPSERADALCKVSRNTNEFLEAKQKRDASMTDSH